MVTGWLGSFGAEVAGCSVTSGLTTGARPSVGAGWEGDAAALAAGVCREHGLKISTNHRGKKTEWEKFGGTWLRLLGVQRTETLLRSPPSTSSLDALWFEVYPTGYTSQCRPHLCLSPSRGGDGEENADC